MPRHCACRGAGRSQTVRGPAWFLASSHVQARTCNVSVFQSASLRHNLGLTNSSSRRVDTRGLTRVLASAVAFKIRVVSRELAQPIGVWLFGERKRISVAIALRILGVLRGVGWFNAESWFAVLRRVRRSSFKAVVSVFQSSRFRRSLRLTIP